MKNQTEFNLAQNINNWKDTLSKSGTLTNENILELENHLLDEIEKLHTKDLNVEECYLIAKKRIGQLDTLKSKHPKVNVLHSFAHKVEPYLKGVLIYFFLISISKILLFTIFSLNIQLNYGASYHTMLPGFIGILITVSIFLIKHPKAIKTIRRLNKISILFVCLLISMPIDFFIDFQTINHIDLEAYQYINFDFNIVNITLLAIVLIGSLLIIFHKKRTNKLILQS